MLVIISDPISKFSVSEACIHTHTHARTHARTHAPRTQPCREAVTRCVRDTCSYQGLDHDNDNNDSRTVDNGSYDVRDI